MSRLIRRRMVLILVVLSAFLLTILRPASPALFVWIALACALGTAIAVAPRTAIKPGDRILDLLILYAVLIVASSVSTFYAARARTQAVQLRFQGLRIDSTSAVAVGVNEDSLDVSLEAGTGDGGWRLRLTQTPEGWVTSTDRPPEELFYQHSTPWLVGWIADKLGVQFWEPLSGLLLSTGMQNQRLTIPASLSSSGLDEALPLALVESSSSLELHIGPYRWELRSASDRLPYRTRALLRNGAYLSELVASTALSLPPMADFIRVRELRPSERIAENPTGLALWSAVRDKVFSKLSRSSARFLISGRAPFVLAPTAPVAPRLAKGEDAIRVLTRNEGSIWSFTLRAGTKQVAVEFDRRPRPHRIPLTAPGACPSGSACNIVSLQRLPGSVVQLLLSEGGLDPTRYSLFGRLESDESNIWYVGDSSRVALSQSREGTWLPVRSKRAGRGRDNATASLNIGADRGAISALKDVLLVTGGTASTLVALFLMFRAALKKGRVHALDEQSLVLAMNGFLALATARLILGLRVTLFSPFQPAGMQTAIGLWVALSTMIAILLTWTYWFPTITAGIESGRSVGVGNVWRAWREQAALLAERSEVGGVRRLLRKYLATIFLIAAFILWTSAVGFRHIAYGMSIGLSVVLMWSALSWVARSRRSADPTIRAQTLMGPWGFLESPQSSGSLEQGEAAFTQTVGNRSSLFGGGIWILALAWLTIVLPLAYFLTAAVLITGYLLQLIPAVNAAVSPPARSLARIRIAIIGLAPLALLSISGETKSAASLGLAILVGVVALRVGITARERARTGAKSRLLFGLLIITIVPFVMLLPLVAIDVGLFMIILIPVVLAVYVASGIFSRLGLGLVAAGVLVGLCLLLFSRLRNFPVQELLTAPDTTLNARVHKMQSFLWMEAGWPAPIRRSLANVAARGLAAQSQEAAERVLAIGGPSQTRDFLPRAIEQTWGTKAYAAAGWPGAGLGESVIGGRGVAEAVSYAENSFSVYILSEHGLLGGLSILVCYALVAVGGFRMLRRRNDLRIGAPKQEMRALLFLAVALVILPAWYVGMSNVGALPITGQNMPFFGLNAWSDVVFCTGIVSFFVVAALRLNQEALGEGNG